MSAFANPVGNSYTLYHKPIVPDLLPMHRIDWLSLSVVCTLKEHGSY
jgi:hypothetical protein